MAPTDNNSDLRPKEWKYSCGLCQKDHPIKTCDAFRSLNHNQRFDVVCQFSYCINCLARSHTRSKCPSRLNCQICSGQHNTLIHYATLLNELDSERQGRPQQRHQSPSQTKRSSSLKCHQRQPSPERPTTSKRSQQQLTPERPTVSKRTQMQPTRERSISPQHHRASSRTGRSVSANHFQPRNNHKRSASCTRPTTSKAGPPYDINDLDFTMVPRPSMPFAWSKVFIPTAQIRLAIPGAEDMWHICRASLNFNATVSRIAVSLQTQLNLETFIYDGTRFAKFIIAPRLPRTTWKREVRAMITSDLPKKPYSSPIYDDHTVDFTADTLADPDPRCNAAIEVELAADLYKDLHRNGSLETDLRHVIAQQTALGYIFIGAIGKIW
ncbi:uncharacterized protein [Musca autumnalis]|uniref:uncharacterized protein n=1 Tax=Musca autumnalis TaxID=221902 RepID=UPI003CEBE60C